MKMKSLKRQVEKYTMLAPFAPQAGDPLTEKLSMSHVNALFNDEIQADSLYTIFQGKTYEMMNLLDLGTKFGERIMTQSRTDEEMKQYFEKNENWF